MYNFYVIMIAGLVFLSIIPVYCIVRKTQGIKGSFDSIDQHPDNFEEFLNDLERDSVEYWFNASKGMNEKETEEDVY